MDANRRSTAGGLLLAAVALGALAGCGKLMKGREDAARAVTEFHDRFNAGDFGAIWDATSDELKQASSREKLGELLAAVRRKLGDVTASTTTSWNVRSANFTTYVALVQDTTYASGRATESFGFVVRDGRAALVSYNVSSNDLILR